MAGLYIHVPFCEKRCLYCDFFSNTDMKFKQPYIKTLVREMELRKEYLKGEPIETIYFGGGTPSQLQTEDFDALFNAIHKHFDLSRCKEVTLEGNPDDLTADYIASLRSFPFNRISMGIQSFHEEDLRFLNRRHDRTQAIRAVADCQDAGYSNISIDLIYGLPGQTLEQWQDNLRQALQLNVPHLSAYHLIYEEGTALYRLLETGKIKTIPEELSVTLFSTLIDTLTQAGYLHYEISNFARPGLFSKHNSSYWNGTHYLGLGPSAHSYNGDDREWNVASLPIYIKGIEQDLPDLEKEELNLATRYNDYVITRLRTMWGLDLLEVKELFGEKMQRYCSKQAEQHLKQGVLSLSGQKLTLTREGIFISDGIMSDLLWV